MVCLLNSCLYVMFRSCFESLASVVPIKLVRAAHCGGAPRIAVRRALRHTVRTWAVVGQNDWQFSNPRIDTASRSSTNHRLSVGTPSGPYVLSFCIFVCHVHSIVIVVTMLDVYHVHIIQL